MGRLLFLAVFGVTGFVVLIALGTWQVQRLEWKQAILAEIDSRLTAEPVDLPEAPEPEIDRYLPVAVAGEMRQGEVHVLVSTRDFGAGYRIIAPFETETGRRIMVDRGFVPTEAKDAERPLGAMRIEGNLHWPQEVDSYTPEADPARNIWFAREVPVLAAQLGTEPVLLIARTPTAPDVTPLPVDSAGIPNDHLQYAITWFGLAAVWAVMTGYFLWRPGRRRDDERAT
ncbi:MAG TPA: SURF1 family protein [Rhodobacteraceae bacterium]|nr:SURF1 family protein [Paracoccaceae bacterium]